MTAIRRNARSFDRVEWGAPSTKSEIIEAAMPLAQCTAGWERMGYGHPSIYTCLDREVDIAHEAHPTNDWWPRTGPCRACELARSLGRRGVGTLTVEERQAERREWEERREFDRLSAKYAGSSSGSDGAAGSCLRCGAAVTDDDWRCEGGRICGVCSGTNTGSGIDEATP